jgi:hypothetical protein
VLNDGERPIRIKGIVEPLNHGMTFDVIQLLAEVAFTLFDLFRAEGFFEDLSVHGVSPFLKNKKAQPKPTMPR